MHYPIHIRFSGLESSPALTAAAEAHAYGLPRKESEIMECWVGFRCDPQAHPTGMPYSVRVDVSIPGHNLVTPRVQHTDLFGALTDAFADMDQQLKAIDARVNHDEYATTINGQLTDLLARIFHAAALEGPEGRFLVVN